jgi:hypothetical protein
VKSEKEKTIVTWLTHENKFSKKTLEKKK